MPTASTDRVAPARACAYTVLRRADEDAAWADRTLVAEARRAGLDGRDRALATRLAFGAVQRQATLDHLIGAYAGRPADQLDPPVRAALRLGVYQLAFLERVPAHAAVSESVELAKLHAPRAQGLVNAVLRRAARDARATVARLPEGTAEQAALRHSYPTWLARRWFEELGADDARALMAAGNRPAEAAVRVNTLRAEPAEVAAELARMDVPVRSWPELPEALVLGGPFDLHGSELFARGALIAQSRAAQAVARVLDPRPGERVLDLCAAPGGKTTHLAALMDGDGEIVAVERDATRARHLRGTLERMGAAGLAEVRELDARALDLPADGAGFHRVLVDPPCSDLGTLAGRPDARWRKSEADVKRLARGVQRALLAAGAGQTLPGGTLAYSTCTISKAENGDQVEWFLSRFGDFTLDDLATDPAPTWQHSSMPACSQSLPHRDGTDGFFVARFRRREAAGA